MRSCEIQKVAEVEGIFFERISIQDTLKSKQTEVLKFFNRISKHVRLSEPHGDSNSFNPDSLAPTT